VRIVCQVNVGIRGKKLKSLEDYIIYLKMTPLFLIQIFVFLLGLSIGSFLNSIIYRLEHNEKLWGRSFCPFCKQILKWYDLIPVVSFLLLKGRCRYCRKKISLQYPLVEGVSGFLFLVIFNHFYPSFFKILFLFYIVSSLLIIFVYDLRHYIIPDKILFPAIILVFLFRALDILFDWKESSFYFNFDPFLLRELVIAVLSAFLFFFFLFAVSKGKWMGFGDVKLSILISLLLGFTHFLVAIFLAFLLGSIIGIALVAIGGKKKLTSQIPFAPFLVTGTLLAIFWAEDFIKWYLNLIS